MTSTGDTNATGVVEQPRRRTVDLSRVIEATTRMVKRHPVLIAAAVLVVGGGGAASAMAALNTSQSPPLVGSECGKSVPGPGFHVFDCMSGGVRGHLHPKELLVVRNDGSSVAHPDYGGQDLEASGGQVFASYDVNLVQVTSSRLVVLVTRAGLARALHRPTLFLWGFGRRFKVDARGDLSFYASTMIRGLHGCQNRHLERMTNGTIRQLSAATSTICY